MIKNVFILFVSLIFFGLIFTGHAYNSRMTTLDLNSKTFTVFLDYGINFQDKDFTISPNPAKNRLNITLPEGMPSANVSVFNVLGKLVYSGEISNFNGSINISNWNSGVYLVKISTNDFTKTKRFIKQ